MAQILIIILALFQSCARTNKEAETVNPLDQLRQKAKLYLSLNHQLEDTHGFHYVHSKCDGVGFTSLCKTAGGCPKADILASESQTEPGRFYRHPAKDCYPNESRTDDSNDHALMRLIYFVATNQRDVGKRIDTYLSTHDYKLGRGDGTQEANEAIQFAYFLPLGDWLGRSLTKTDQTPNPILQTGYRGHLQVLYVLLNGLIHGALSDLELTMAREQRNRVPENAIYQAVTAKYTDGDQSKAIETLLDPQLFPVDRLPNSSDRCEEYLFQRDPGSDWQPCSENKTHSGTDLLFAAWIIGAL